MGKVQAGVFSRCCVDRAGCDLAQCVMAAEIDGLGGHGLHLQALQTGCVHQNAQIGTTLQHGFCTIRLESSSTNTRIRGWLWRRPAITGPMRSPVSRNGMAMLTEPSGPMGRRCRRSHMASASESRRRASSYSRLPAGVAVTPAWVRSSNWMPNRTPAS